MMLELGVDNAESNQPVSLPKLLLAAVDDSPLAGNLYACGSAGSNRVATWRDLAILREACSNAGKER